VNFLMRARTFNRSIALAVSALFVLALVSAQPHRVHHFFQEIEHAHGQGEADSNHAGHSQAPAKTPQTECVIQTVSQHCSAIPVAIAKIILIVTASEAYHPMLRRWIYHFVSSPFLQRAPPATGSSFNI